MFAFYIVFITLLLTTLCIYFYTKNQVMDSEKQLDTLSEHRTRATLLHESWLMLQYDVRGYALYGETSILNEITKEKANIEKQTSWFKRNVTTEVDESYANDTRFLYESYSNRVLPSVINYVKEKKEGKINEPFLQQNTLSKLTPAVNNNNQKLSDSNNLSLNLRENILNMETTFTTYRNEINKQEKATQKKLGSQVNTSQILGGINIGILILLTLLFVRPFTTRLTRQLKRLNRETDRLAQGENTEPIPILNEQDEIGELTKTFNQMSASIIGQKKNLQLNNEALQMQSEELLAQQEELHTQQEELEEALNVTLQNEQHLKYRNELTETLAARETFTAYEMVIEKLVAITHAEFGAIIFYDRDHLAQVFSFGITETAIEKITMPGSIVERANLLRRITQSDKQVALDHPLPHPYYIFEAAIPVLDVDSGEILACIYLARYKMQFEAGELEDMMSFARQISLSLLRMRMFDEMQVEKEKTTSLIHSIREAMMYIENNKVLANHALLNLFDYSQHNDDKKNIRGLISLDVEDELLVRRIDQKEKFNNFMDKVYSNTIPHEDIQVTLNDGAKVVTIYAEEVRYHASLKGIMLVLKDVTHEVEVDRLKSELISTVSHELRTPLSSIYGFTELLLAKSYEEQRQRKYLETIHSETQRLSLLVDNFLDIQRMESNQQTFMIDTVDLVEIIQKIVTVQREEDSLHIWNVQSNEQGKMEIEADQEKMTQLFTNLIYNAKKYSPEGGAIEICMKQSSDNVLIQIRDKGIGISENDQSKVFDKFYRAHTSSHPKIGGTGLGLSICKEIIEAHNGKIEISSKLNKGTIVEITLPISSKL
ncbi:ATP-binding protein [Exiguobacterium sp. A1_3_1]|uniref:ATP-binding protein n=1 Tax=Exiguobacterium sp. A1_3_1 TaxID=2651871 RepID=UPI003B986305